ncbi:hypothetical protein GQ53DRAFT_637203 [Thozetella sp. PMI_491]|nr:hypothetical protein GQ53DRAFT_637203 [Thozetella sp. PMI_491]
MQLSQRTRGLDLLVLALCSSSCYAGPVAPRDEVTAVVDLATKRGPPRHLAAGFIYGIPDTSDQIPDHWYTDMGFNYGRAGGAQLDAPNRGWIYGMNEYYGRLASTLSNYWTCRKYNADYVILPHDVWVGTDHTNDSTLWPGDNGDWADYEKFLRQLMSDLKANNALDGLVWDIWNEPDIGVFWERSQQQWIDLYIRSHNIIRSDPAFNTVKISGPTLAWRPMSSNSWWTNWLSQISGNNTVPDQYAFHLEGSLDAVDNDLEYTNASLGALLKEYGLPDRQININEYAEFIEQVPAGYVWWISQLERYDAIGLLGNWLGGTALHDLFANLITKSANPWDYAATDYVSAPGYQVYKYYNLNMTGERLQTTRSGDRWLDVYATVSDRVRVLTGVKVNIGTWQITIENLGAAGYPESGTVVIDTWGFDGSSVWDVVSAPSFRNRVSHDYTGNSVTFPIYQTDNHTAWAFEFDNLL